MLTGQLPFTSSTSNELAHQHRNSPPPEPRRINPAINEDLNRIILKVLSKEAAARYRTADQLGRVLITFTKKPGPVQLSEPIFPTNPEAKQQSFIVTKSPREVDTQNKINNSETMRISQEIDWITISLGLIALLFAGGLIPFWLWVYFSLKGQ